MMGRKATIWFVPGCVLYLALVHCSLLVDTSNLTGQTTADGGPTGAEDARVGPLNAGPITDSEVGATDGDVTQRDGGACIVKGGAMVRIESPVESVYRIDSTEVTQKQYSAFLFDTRGSVADQPSQCRDNTNLVPYAGAGYEPVGRASYPDRSVFRWDWNLLQRSS